MKNIVLCFLAVILTGTLSFANASDDGLQFGVRAGVNKNKYDLFMDWGEYGYIHFFDLDAGYGFEAGLAAKYPLKNWLSLNSEVSFCYRVLGIDTYKGISHYFESEEDSVGVYAYDNTKNSISEMAILVPVMVQFTPSKRFPVYASAGTQFGFPFYNIIKYSSKYTHEGKILYEGTKNEKTDNRSFIDFGAAVGVGYMAANPNLGAELRFVFNLNNVYNGPDTDPDARIRLMYFTFGISYFL